MVDNRGTNEGGAFVLHMISNFVFKFTSTMVGNFDLLDSIFCAKINRVQGDNTDA